MNMQVCGMCKKCRFFKPQLSEIISIVVQVDFVNL